MLNQTFLSGENLINSQLLIKSFDRKSTFRVIKIFGREILSLMRRQKTLTKSQRPENGRATIWELIRSSIMILNSIFSITVKYKRRYEKRHFFPRNGILAKNHFFKGPDIFSTYFFRKNVILKKNHKNIHDFVVYVQLESVFFKYYLAIFNKFLLCFQ